MGGNHSVSVFFRKHKRALLLLGAVLLVLSVLFWLALPRQLFNDPLCPVLFAADGRLLGARLAADEQWRFPRMKSVPERFFQGLLQYEDRRFFRHGGVG